MRQLTALIGLLLLAPFLAGCPFESKVSLPGSGTVPLDSAIVGSWRGLDQGDTIQVLLLPFDKSAYYVELREMGGDVQRFRIALAPVAGERLLEVSELSPKGPEESFVLARYTVSADGALRVRFVGESLVPKSLQSDPRGLADFLAAHINDAALYDEEAEVLLRRVDATEEGK